MKMLSRVCYCLPEGPETISRQRAMFSHYSLVWSTFADCKNTTKNEKRQMLVAFYLLISMSCDVISGNYLKLLIFYVSRIKLPIFTYLVYNV